MVPNEIDHTLNSNNTDDDDSDILNDSQPLDLTSEIKINMCGKNLNMTRPQFRTIILLSTYYIISSSYYSLLGKPFKKKKLKYTKVC